MAIIDVEDLVGKHFNLPNSDGEPRDAETIEATLDHADRVNNDSILTKFRCRINNNDAHQEIIEHDQVMDHIESSNNQPVFWELRRAHELGTQECWIENIKSLHNVCLGRLHLSI